MAFPRPMSRVYVRRQRRVRRTTQFRLPHDGRCLLFAQVLEHHRARPNLTDGIGDTFTGNVRRGAVYRFEHRGEIFIGIDVCARRDRDGPRYGRAEV